MAKSRKRRAVASASHSGGADDDSDADVHGVRRAGASSIAAISSYQQVMDSEDEFHEQRDAIGLDSEKPAPRMRKVKRNGKTSWEEVLSDEDQEVFGLGLDDSDDDDDDSDAYGEDDGDLDSAAEANDRRRNSKKATSKKPTRDEDVDFDPAVLDALDREDDMLLEKSNRLLKTKRDYLDEDEYEEFDISGKQTGVSTKKDRESEEPSLSAWGKKRKTFYNRDEEVLSDEEAAQQELEETQKLQRQRLENLDEQDFLGLDDNDGLGDSRTKSRDGTIENSFFKIIRGTAAAPTENGQLLVSERSANVEYEVVDKQSKLKALAKMDAEALKALAETQIPDVVRHLAEFDERWDEVKTVLGPSLKWMLRDSENGEPRPVEPELVDAKNYVQLKYTLLMSYLTNILFYLSLRASSSTPTVRSHPVTKVISNLGKLLNRLEKHVEGRRASESTNDGVSGAGKSKRSSGTDNAEENGDDDDDRGFPNLLDRIADFVESRVLSVDDAEEDGQEDENSQDEWIDGTSEDSASEAVSSDQNPEDLLTAEEMKEVMASLRKERKPPKAKDQDSGKPKKSKPAQTPSDEDFKVPEFRPAKKTKDNGAKKSLKEKKRSVDDDFGETDLNAVDMMDKMAKKRDLQFHVKRIDQEISKRKKDALFAGAGDDDLPMRDKNGKLISTKKQSENEPSKKDAAALFSKLSGDDDVDDAPANEAAAEFDNSALDDEDYFGEDNDYDAGETGKKRDRRSKDGANQEDDGSDEDEALAYYNSVAKATKAIKDKKESAFQAYKKRLEGDGTYRDNDLQTPGVKRATGWTIDANKGLTPRRKKEDRNSRVKIRNKFAKKQKKLGSIKAIVKDKSTVGAYGGEATGIKSRLSKSVRF
ncbi:hypothetical protein HDU83_006180 [Entophlyctis luteolus]|nr:hypothetical protein HDU83_006180 [Entophlyctis luteolus]